jgi:hypothetical protein
MLTVASIPHHFIIDAEENSAKKQKLFESRFNNLNSPVKTVPAAASIAAIASPAPVTPSQPKLDWNERPNKGK